MVRAAAVGARGSALRPLQPRQQRIEQSDQPQLGWLSLAAIAGFGRLGRLRRVCCLGDCSGDQCCAQARLGGEEAEEPRGVGLEHATQQRAQRGERGGRRGRRRQRGVAQQTVRILPPQVGLLSV